MCASTMDPDFLIFRGFFGSYSSLYSSNQSFSRSRLLQHSSVSSHSSASDLLADVAGGAPQRESKTDKRKSMRKSLPTALEARRITELAEVSTEVVSTSPKAPNSQLERNSVNKPAEKPASQTAEKAVVSPATKSAGDALKEETTKAVEAPSGSQAKSSSQPLPAPAEATPAVKATPAVETTKATETTKESETTTKTVEAPAGEEGKRESTTKGSYRTIVVPPISTDSSALKTGEVGFFGSPESSR